MVVFIYTLTAAATPVWRHLKDGVHFPLHRSMPREAMSVARTYMMSATGSLNMNSMSSEKAGTESLVKASTVDRRCSVNTQCIRESRPVCLQGVSRAAVSMSRPRPTQTHKQKENDSLLCKVLQKVKDKKNQCLCGANYPVNPVKLGSLFLSWKLHPGSWCFRTDGARVGH